MSRNGDLKEAIIILQAGINRFYDDGFYEWDKRGILGVLDLMITIDDPLVQKIFKKWEDMGVIRIIGLDECYFKVLRKFLKEEEECK